MTRSHSLVADAGELFIENANCRRRSWNLVNGATWRFPRDYTRQKSMARYLIRRLCSGRAKKTDPASPSRMGSPERERAKLNRNVMDKPAQEGSQLHV